MLQETKIREAGEKGMRRGGTDPNAPSPFLLTQH